MSPKNVCIKITVIIYLNFSKIPDILFVIKKNLWIVSQRKKSIHEEMEKGV